MGTPESSAQDPTLRALKSRDALERRASKRFSAYTFNKMGIGQGFGHGFGNGNLGMSMLSLGATPQGTPSHSSRKGSVGDSAKRPSRLNVVNNNADISLDSPSDSQSEGSHSHGSGLARRRGSSRARRLGVPSPAKGSAASSTDSLPFLDAGSPIGDQQVAQAQPGVAVVSLSTATPTQASYPPAGTPAGPDGAFQVFLQLGRQTKRATIQSSEDVSIASLRMLFVERFSYNSGQEDFPPIYIQDPHSGVSFELENLKDVGHNTLLTLNIEPLDQVKQHLDLTLGTLTRELRELKTAFLDRERETKRMSMSNHYAPAQAAEPASERKINDADFAAAGKRVNRSSTTSSAELKSQYDELQILRRELAVMRQVQADFSSDTTALFKDLREQTKRVREIAATDAPLERNFIVAGKARLDSSSQEILTLVEDLQDTVDDLKMDVIQRGVKPKPAMIKKITTDITKAATDVENVEKYVQDVKPSWKKTWETELQSIVEEQGFLNHQESLIADLREDLNAVQVVFADIQQVVKLRGSSSSRGAYLPPPAEDGHQGLNTVMLEVRGQNVDHEKRLRALQAAERQRKKEIEERTDEFAEELAGFVDGKVLRKTGGHLEVERVRQRRDKATLQAMFAGGGDAVGGAPTVPAGPVEKPAKLLLGKVKKETV